MAKKVVVLGKNYSTPLGVVRSLSKAGFTVELLYIAAHKGDSKTVGSSKHIHEVVEVVGRQDQKVINALLSHFTESTSKSILFPTDDYTASLIDRFTETLNKKFDMPHIVGGSVTQMMDKSVQGAMAKSCGLNTAREWIVSLDVDEIHIPDDVVFPCFVKPMVSALGSKSELERCDDHTALEKKLDKMQKRLKERSVLIQEFLHIQQEYTFGGICNDQDVYIPALIKKSIVAQVNRGITLKATVIATDEIAEELPQIITFLKSVRYVGMFDMEVVKTDKGLYFGELNLRCGGPSYAYFRCGINLPELAVRTIDSGRLEVPDCPLKLNQYFFNNKVAWEDYMDGFLTPGDMRKLYKECDFSLLSDDDDPLPEKIFNKTMKPIYKKRRLKKKIKKLLHM